MLKLSDVRDVHLEISSLCNASCSWCPRTFWGYPHNGGYPELNLTLDNAKKIFTSEFLKQLTSIRINGNFGDIVMNPDGVEIVEYFRNNNKDLIIEISTNGGARNTDFWSRLAKTDARIKFALDGLTDTHHLYRQNTLFETVIKNAQTVIDAGGHAIWKMIKFKHNQHQIDECRRLSKSMGFSDFILVSQGRDTAPVFNRHGELTHVLGDYTGEKEFEILFHKKLNDTILLEDIIDQRVPGPVDCIVKKQQSIYIAANGDVSPCCWTGFYPQTYGKGQYHQAANAQLQPLIKKNNAFEYPLNECIEWFKEIEKSWSISTFEAGRLVICNDVCGKKQ